MTAILVTGATGFVGKPLVDALLASGATVTALSRDRERAAAQMPGATVVEADIESAGEWTRALAGADAVVHLAGENISGSRWNARQKQKIRDSRVESTARLVDALAALSAAERPKTLVSASGIDYYGFAKRGTLGEDDDVTESDPPGDSFLARVCRDAEREAARAETMGVRVVRTRFGLVLGPGGGALGKLMAPFKFFAGGRIGSGDQWFSWIHLEDVVGVIRTVIDDPRYVGPVNVVAPQALRQRELAKALGKALHRPSVVPTPAFAVKLAVGEMGEYILEGRKVVPRALEQLGYTFSRPTIQDALRDLT